MGAIDFIHREAIIEVLITRHSIQTNEGELFAKDYLNYKKLFKIPFAKLLSGLIMAKCTNPDLGRGNEETTIRALALIFKIAKENLNNF